MKVYYFLFFPQKKGREGTITMVKNTASSINLLSIRGLALIIIIIIVNIIKNYTMFKSFLFSDPMESVFRFLTGTQWEVKLFVEDSLKLILLKHHNPVTLREYPLKQRQIY